MLCTKCGAVHDENEPCENCGTVYDNTGKDLSQVTVKRLSSGDIVFYRPPISDGNTAPLPADTPSEACSQVYETPNFEKLAEVINPFADGLVPPSFTISEAEKCFSGDLFIDPVELISYDSAAAADSSPDNFLDSFSDLSDFVLPENAPSQSSEDLSLKGLDDISEECRAQIRQEIFENTFRPVKHEPMEKKSAKTIDGSADKDDLKNDSISVAGWIGIIFLLLIPGLNLLLLIIWACGGCRKKAKASFARAALLVLLIFAVIFTASWFAFGNSIYGAVHDLLVKDGSPSGLTLGIFKAIQDAVKFFGIDMIITPAITM